VRKRLLLCLAAVAVCAGTVFSDGVPEPEQVEPVAVEPMEPTPAPTPLLMEGAEPTSVPEMTVPAHTHPQMAPSKMKEVPKASVRFESEPTSADVELNGLYVGSTPIQITLPEGGVHFVRIMTPGYLPWETRIKAYNGLEVVAKLSKEISRTEDTKVTTGAQ
jgi:hypothetical protein